MPSVERIGLARGPALRRPIRPAYLPSERAGSSALLAQLGLRGDGVPRLQLGVSSSDTPEIVFGSGTALDLRAIRSAISTLVIDNGAGAAATLQLIGQMDVAAEATPATPAAGYGRLYFNTTTKSLHQVNDAGVDADLLAATSTLNFLIDGGGSVIATGIKGDLIPDFAATINRVTLLADQSGSVVVDIWKAPYASYPPTVANTITASDLPTLSGAANAQDSTLTGWTTAIAAGDVLRFNVNSASTITRLLVSLKVTRT